MLRHHHQLNQWTGATRLASNLSSDRIEELLSEILKWIKFAGAKEVRQILASALDTDQKRLIYHLSDGDKGSVEIANIVKENVAKTSDTTVRRYWESWARVGIVDPLKVRGGERFKKSFELEDFGIRVPEIQMQTKSVTAPGEEMKV